MTDANWLDLASTLAANEANEVRGEAVEVLVAEIARCRLVDRLGWAHVQVVTGQRLVGRLEAGGIDGHLAVREATGDVVLVAAPAVVRVVGSRIGLRAESGVESRSIGSWLREVQAGCGQVWATSTDAVTVRGRLAAVAADHVEVDTGDGVVVLALAAVVAWRSGR